MWTKENLDNYIHNNMFELHYQLQYELKTKKIIGAEVLVRFKNYDNEIIAPTDFVPALEQNNHIAILDLWVFQEICKTQCSWRKIGYPVIPVTVNFSMCTMSSPFNIYDLLMIVREYDLTPRDINIDLTGNFPCLDPIGFEKSMQYLSKNGFKLLLDNFGVGSSTLSIFSDVPFEGFKIDRNVFQKSKDNPRKRAILQNIIQLGEKINIDVISEGIETQEELNLLIDLGCLYGQGFYLSKPMDKKSFEEFLTSSPDIL